MLVIVPMCLLSLIQVYKVRAVHHFAQFLPVHLGVKYPHSRGPVTDSQ